MCSNTKRRSIQDQPVAGGRRSRAGTRIGFWGMLGLLRMNNLPQQTSAQGGTAIIDDRRTLGGIVTLEVAGAVLAQGCGVGEERGAAARIHTLWSASSGHPKCRERATCVHDPGHCERLAGRCGSSSVPSCGSSSRGVRGSPAVCITEGKKTFCCVTTRRRNFWALSDLGRGLGLLAALFLCLGVLGFGVGVLATFRLPLRRLPAVDLPQAFRILAVALVPTPRLVLASAPFVQAGPRARAARSGLGTVLCLNVVVAHGRFDLPRESSGRMCHHSPRALSKREQNDCLPV